MYTPICSTSVRQPSLDPPESTLHAAPKGRGEPVAGWPAVVASGGFHLVSPPGTAPGNNPPTAEPEPAQDEDTLPARAARGENRKKGIDFRHQSWHPDRERVLQALDQGGFTADRFYRFRECGSQTIIYQDPSNPDNFKIGCNRCHDRFCLPCSQDRARLIAANLQEQRPPSPIRFATFTLKHSDAPLAEQLDRLYSAFAKLRKRALWKRTVSGGAVFLEVKLSRTDNRWHPHLHVMLQGRYIPQNLLADLWLEITGDSHIVDIRLAKNERVIARYLASYVTKGWSSHVFHDREKLVEIMHALAGRKLVATFGTWSKLNLLKAPTPQTWVALGTLQELCERVRNGDAEARRILTLLHADDYLPPLQPCIEPPDG